MYVMRFPVWPDPNIDLCVMSVEKKSSLLSSLPQEVMVRCSCRVELTPPDADAAETDGVPRESIVSVSSIHQISPPNPSTSPSFPILTPISFPTSSASFFPRIPIPPPFCAVMGLPSSIINDEIAHSDCCAAMRSFLIDKWPDILLRWPLKATLNPPSTSQPLDFHRGHQSWHLGKTSFSPIYLSSFS